MRSYSAQQRKPGDYIIAGLVAFVAVGLVLYALGHNVVQKLHAPQAPIKTKILPPPPKLPPPPPPMPPPAVIQPPPPYVPPPKIRLPSPKKPPRQKVTHEKPTHPQPPAVSAPAAATSSTSGPAAEGDHRAGSIPINGARPEYPSDAQEENREGHVVVSCDIGTNGRPANCQIVSASGGQDFVDSARDFLSRVRYQPAVINGQPVVERNHRLTIDFVLGDE